MQIWIGGMYVCITWMIRKWWWACNYFQPRTFLLHLASWIFSIHLFISFSNVRCHGRINKHCVFVSALQSVTKMEPPMFIRELQDIQCHDGDNVEMVVEVKGSILLIVKQNFLLISKFGTATLCLSTVLVILSLSENSAGTMS